MKPLKSLVIAVFSLVAAGASLSENFPVVARCQETAVDDVLRAEFKNYRDCKRINRTPLVVPLDPLTLALFN